MTLAVVLLTIAVAMLGLLVAGLLRSHAAILRRLHELGAGLEDTAGREPAPTLERPTSSVPRPGATVRAGRRARDLAGVRPSGDAVGLRTSGVGHDTVMVFLSTDCATCQGFWEELAASAPELPRGARLVVVTKGPEDESPAAAARLAPEEVTVVMSSEAWRDFGVPGAPYVVQVDGESGRIRGEGTAADWTRMRALLDDATGDSALASASARRKASADAAREREVDQALLAAGIRPGDPSLYPAATHTHEVG